WLTLRRRFNEVLQTAIADGVVSDRRRLRELFRELQAQGRVYLDANQQAWMEVENQGELRRVGLTAATIVSPESDRRLALQLLLARMDYLLYTGSQHREIYPDVEADWPLLQRAEQVAAAPVTRVVASRQ